MFTYFYFLFYFFILCFAKQSFREKMAEHWRNVWLMGSLELEVHALAALHSF